jgi:hypothetical protein
MLREDRMSKFNALWEFVGQQSMSTLKLTFAEIREIAGIEIDHSFLNFKKELALYGYQVGKISLKEQTVVFHKLES